MSVITPFRYDTSTEKREQIGTLLSSPAYYDDNPHFVAKICALLLSHSQACDMIFVGRSPELMYEFLRGAFHSNKYIQQHIHILHFSMRNIDLEAIPSSNIEAMKTYLTSLQLSPETIVKRRRPAALVDFICTGSSFDNFFHLLHTWCKEEKVDWNAVRRKILVITIESEKFSSEGYDYLNWVHLLGGLSCITRLFIDITAWEYFADEAPQSTNSYTWNLWGKEEEKEIAKPYHSNERIAGLRLALDTFDFANSKMGKKIFIMYLTKHTFAMRFAWYRSLVHALKGKQPPKIHDNVHQINLKRQSHTVAPRGAVAGAVPKTKSKLQNKFPVFPKSSYKKSVDVRRQNELQSRNFLEEHCE